MPNNISILLEQSGYDLDNLGDRAMLEAGIVNLRSVWPDAKIKLLTSNPVASQALFPGVQPLYPFPRLGALGAFGRVSRGFEAYLKPISLRRRRLPWAEPRMFRPLLDHICASDLVISTGGGYLNDIFRRHASGVLAVMSAAQRLNIPTAMFGQGIGPFSRRRTCLEASAVLEKLEILGLRATVPPELEKLRQKHPNWVLTGDDALCVAGTEKNVADGVAIGLNMRLSSYAGFNLELLKVLRPKIDGLRNSLGASVVPVPISIGEKEPDMSGISKLSGEVYPGRISTTSDLKAQVEMCRVLVTASYHASVFALARGIPVVALSSSKYYDQKYAGLRYLFPSNGLSVIDCSHRSSVDDFDSIVRAAWDMESSSRVALVTRARSLAQQSRQLWRSLLQPRAEAGRV